MIIIFRRPYITDLLWICLEVNEIATASIIYEEIMKKGPISSDDHEMISQIKEDLKNDLWGMKKNMSKRLWTETRQFGAKTPTQKSS